MPEIAFDSKTKATVLLGVRRSLRAGIKLAADILLPPQCVFCDKDISRVKHVNPANSGEILLCSDCRESLEADDWQWCMRCGSTKTPYTPENGRCVNCQRVSLRYNAVLPLGRYRDELRDAVLRMKYRHHDHLSITMGRLYALHRGRHILGFKPDIAVPVPMYWTRQLRSGTNSAEILAVEIARNLGIPAIPGLLTRCCNTKPQRNLSPTQRKKNVQGAFRLTTGYAIQGARVLLVDDILTTGATCQETAGVLRRAGAKSVVVAVLARAEGQSR